MAIRERVQSCRPDQLIGVWAIDQEYFDHAFAQAIRIDPVELRKQNEEAAKKVEEKPIPPYDVDQGVAKLRLEGPSTKHPSSYNSMFGGYSTLQKQKALRDATKDPSVKSIALLADTPGGTVIGTPEFADEVIAANKIKPVYGIVDDQCTSAGMWILSGCRKIFANRTARVGSIGTTVRLYDYSKAMNTEGIEAIPIDSGKFKSVGMRGKPITEEDKKELQREINGINDLFINAVATGRKLDPQKIRDFEARTFVGEEAKKMGLVDEICSVEEALKIVQKSAASGHAGITKSTATNVPPVGARSDSMSFSQQQVEAIRKVVPGAVNAEEASLPSIVADYAVAASKETTQLREDLRKAKETLAATEELVPEQCDPKVAAGHINLYNRELSQLVKEEKLSPEQAEILRGELYESKDKPRVDLVQADGTVNIPSTTLSKVLEVNKPKGLSKERTSVQTLNRVTPGGADDEPSAETPEESDRKKKLSERVAARMQRPNTAAVK